MGVMAQTHTCKYMDITLYILRRPRGRFSDEEKITYLTFKFTLGSQEVVLIISLAVSWAAALSALSLEILEISSQLIDQLHRENIKYLNFYSEM